MAEAIKISKDKMKVPNVPIIPFIEGDGTGRDIWKASVRVFDAAVAKAYHGKKKIEWVEVLAGEKAFNETGEWLPKATLSTIKKYSVAIKGPLTTPIGGGIRSLNVTLRQVFDLYACVRPVQYFKGVPSPVKDPSKVDVVIFRENTEDVYSGIEFKAGSAEAKALSDFLFKKFGKKLRAGSGIGIKPMSKFGSQRLVRRALQFAIDHKKPSVTMMHKGNIMKYTEGAFRDWGYEIAKKEFSKSVISEDDLWAKHNGEVPKGLIVLKDRIADSMFQQILLRPEDYSVVATPNLNGDYFSDAAAAQTGGLGMAPGANIGDKAAIFEATHGTAPKYADKDVINPSSVILSGVMMFEYLGWQEVADSIRTAVQNAIHQKRVTYDLARQMEGSTKVRCSEFADAIISNLK